MSYNIKWFLKGILVNYISIKMYQVYQYIFNDILNNIRGESVKQKIKNKGINLKIHGYIDVIGKEQMQIGNYVRIGRGCFFDCSGGLIIRDNVQISRNVLIYTRSHKIHGDTIPYGLEYKNNEVIIDNSVWIGMNVVIAPGTIIGEGAIIGMGSIISGNIPPCSIVVNQKHRIVGYRNAAHFHKLKSSKQYFGKIYPNN